MVKKEKRKRHNLRKFTPKKQNKTTTKIKKKIQNTN